MHAIIETGGKQFRVAPGDVVRVPKLAGDAGSEVELGKVLAVFQDSGGSAPSHHSSAGANVVQMTQDAIRCNVAAC